MTLRYSLLDEPLIGVRLAANGQRARLSLPALYIALAEDRVRDFPALRPHQRHPWHAFLVQLAAMALHRAGRGEPFTDEAAWRDALLALTPEHPDGAAWCLVAPIDRPAFLQAPVPEGTLDGWSDDTPTPDSLDILATSKNHDLKQSRIYKATQEDWVFALLTLQTAAPYGGSGNHRVARMSSAYSSRPGVGIYPSGSPGRRWKRDVSVAVDKRQQLAEQGEYKLRDGIGLLWLQPWDGSTSISFTKLDPMFIEVSRRIRLIDGVEGIRALRTTSKTTRISKSESDKRKGSTGDLWTPLETKKGEFQALNLRSEGFDYRLMTDLLFSTKFRKSPSQIPTNEDDTEGLAVLAQGIAGGQSTTDGYHERRVPISRKVRTMLIQQNTDRLAAVAAERVDDIAKIHRLLKQSLKTLFYKGKAWKRDKELSKTVLTNAKTFARPFEQGEDARFFDGPLGLNAEIEAEGPEAREAVRLAWYRSMAERAEAILRAAFEAGPRGAEQRYRARAAALSRFHDGLRSDKVLPALAAYYRNNRQTRQEDPNGRHQA